MTQEAEGPEIVEIALPASLRDRNDVVSVPQAAATSNAGHAIQAQPCGPRGPSRSLERKIRCDRVDLADRTVASIAREYLVAQIAGICTETPLMDAIVAAKGSAPPGDDLEMTPAAERQAIGSGRKTLALSAAT